jgi:multicomponent Na+:H+ antiporter subunit C
MELILSILVGTLYTAGVYLMLRRSILKFVIGVILISNATNLLVFLSSTPIGGNPVFVAEEATETAALADPLPQALLLTAVVIGLGITAFTLALKYKFFESTGTYDLDVLKETDK